MKMHDDEIIIDDSLVAELVAKQFPDIADLPILRLNSYGTDNILYRVGTGFLLRFPKIDWVIGQIAKEFELLPQISKQVSLKIPYPLKIGKPQASYPWNWGVYKWLEGESKTITDVKGDILFADDLADFVRSLKKLNIPKSKSLIDNHYKNFLQPLNENVKIALKQCCLYLDDSKLAAIENIWNESLKLPGWKGDPVWVHGDFHIDNFLFTNNKLSAVLDFNNFGLNDPAIDLTIAWNTFDNQVRAYYKEILEIDDNTWFRGRAFALAKALFALPYYQNTNPQILERSYYIIDQILL